MKIAAMSVSASFPRVTAVAFLGCLLLLNAGQDRQSRTAAQSVDEPRQNSPSTTESARYSDAVVAKAEKILEEAGLRRSGRSIRSTEASALSRGMTQASRDRRQLELVRDDWERVDRQDAMLREKLEKLNVQYAALNTQLARSTALDTRSRNQLIAQVNANQATTRVQLNQRERLQKTLDKKRSELSQAEAEYAETVLGIRKEYKAVRGRLAEALGERNVQIALRVMATNFQTEPELTASEILDSVDRRLTTMEEEIFSETIPLDVEPNGSLYVDVSVGDKSTRMVVDSGATLISLPAATAAELGIQVPSDARELRMLVADGRAISARAVTLDRVRVGQFEAKNVPAAVLDTSAVVAEPLLGMSFLGNFKFEVNTADKSLKMLQVAPED